MAGMLAAAVLAGHAAANPFQRFEAEPTDPAMIVLAQAHLDNLWLGPGKIDGRMGEFTRIAAAEFNARLRVPPDNWWRLLRDARRTVKEPFAEVTVPEDLGGFVGPLPFEPADQQGLPYLVYRSYPELMAERYHTTESFLAGLNPDQPPGSWRPGSRLKVPNVTPFRIEGVPAHRKFPQDPALSARTAEIDIASRTLKIREAGRLVANFPVTPGEDRFIPYGEWSVRVMVTTPEFRWDRQMLEQGQRGEEFYQLPPGPNSPVGILWAGLDKDGIGLHGTNNPYTIGRARSAGCIRLANWDAIRLAGLIRPGSRVVVR
jgi:lipoprotein-anchoring transpeptidase ErfK/SrfK